MDDFLHWIASLKGIELEPGTELRFQMLSFPAGGLALLTIVGILLAVAMVVMVYRRDGHDLTPAKRGLLATLRALAVLCVVFLILEPSLVAVKKETRPGHTILLLDLSQSMDHVGAFRHEEVTDIADAWRQLGIEEPQAVSRIDLVKALLAHEDQKLLEVLGKKNELKLFGFSGGLEPLPVLAPKQPAEGREDNEPQGVHTLPPPPRLILEQLRATGRYSNLGNAVRSALDRSKGAEVAGVIILTDGRRNAGPQGAEVARMLSQRKIPSTFVLGIGDPSETLRSTVSRIESPEKVFQRDPFEISANISTQGYEELTLTVRLVRVDKERREQTIATKQVRVGGTQPDARVTFKKLTSDETGQFTYRVEIDPPTGETPSPEKHRKQQLVEVLGEQTRVLLLAATSSFEYRILRNQLIRDKTIEVSCWLQSADPDFPQDGDTEVRIKELPAERKELDAYDVLIFIDPNPDKITRTFCEWCAEHIVDNGCGMWWVCGEKYSLRALREEANTWPLVEILPVVPDLRTADLKYYNLGFGYPQAWPFKLTPDGARGLASKVTRIAESKDETPHMWGRLPGFHLTLPVKKLKPAAISLVAHTDPHKDFRMDDGAPTPVVATQFIGAGRVLFTGMDETYRWRSIYEDAYNRFWVKGIRYLYEGRLNAGNSRFKILLGDERVELGDSIEIVVEAKDDGYQPLVVDEIEVVVAKDDATVDALKLLGDEEVPGRYKAIFRPREIGFHSVMNSANQTATVSFQVVPAAFEKEGPVDLSELGAIAGAKGGQLLRTPQELLDAVGQIRSRTATDSFSTPHAIWDSWVTLALIVTLLSVEWYLRKRFNLL